jgi:membrane-associated HD superfamily phosphohydrolase
MIRVFKHYVSHAVILLGIVDFALLILAGELAWDLRIYQIGAGSQPFADRAGAILAFAAIVMTALIGVGSYGTEALRSMRFAVARLLVAVSLGVIGMSLLDFLVQGETFWRSVLLYAMAIAILVLLLVFCSYLFSSASFSSDWLVSRVMAAPCSQGPLAI